MSRIEHREAFSLAVFAGEKVPKADEGAVLAQAAQSGTAPHPHFVSPSPRKKTRGEGLSLGRAIGRALRDRQPSRGWRQILRRCAPQDKLRRPSATSTT